MSEKIWAESIYGANTRQGLVKLTIGREERIISPVEARAFAYSILECAEAAESDELLITWLTEKVSQPIESAAQILMDFRRMRERIQQREGR